MMLSLSLTPFSTITEHSMSYLQNVKRRARLTVRLGVDLGGSPRRDVWVQATFRLDQVGRKQCVDQCRLSKSCLT